MNITQNMDIAQKQTQKLILSQQMRQSLDILQMNCMELKESVEREIMENPMLEFYDNPEERADRTESKEDSRKESEDNINWEEYFEQEKNLTPVQWKQQADRDDDSYGFEKFSHKEMTLQEYLFMQLHMEGRELTDQENTIGEYLITAIDEDGYLLTEMSRISADLGVSEDVIEPVLNLIQTFDPSGVGARDIGECLAIQLRQLDMLTDQGEMLLKDHLLDIANNQFAKVSKATGISREELADFKMQLKELNPRPGVEFDNNETVKYVIPDGSIDWIDGELMVHINNVSAPHLQISSYYRKYLSHPEQTDEATRAYLKQRLDSASLLIKNINSRRETVRNIITVIAEYQKPFFLSQEKYKRAMSLKLIADSIGMHESTVSRAIRGKFIQTPRGVFELKSFLEHGYSQSGGDVSASCIKGKIAELIQAEDSSRPLSDQKIADSLAEEGFAIARRTIAKYREALGIPVASKRKY